MAVTHTSVQGRSNLPGQLEIPQTGEDMGAVAKIKANKPLQASKPQNACDIGLFSDEATQIDLIDLLCNNS